MRVTVDSSTSTPASAYESPSSGSTVLNITWRTTRPGKRNARSCSTTPPRPPPQVTMRSCPTSPRTTPAGHDAPVSGLRAPQCLGGARLRRDVVEAVIGEPRVPEAAHVGHDHLEARLRERAHVAPPDALRLGPPVQQYERETADALAQVRDLDAAGRGPVQGEVCAVHRRRLKEYVPWR